MRILPPLKILIKNFTYKTETFLSRINFMLATEKSIHAINFNIKCIYT